MILKRGGSMYTFTCVVTLKKDIGIRVTGKILATLIKYFLNSQSQSIWWPMQDFKNFI